MSEEYRELSAAELTYRWRDRTVLESVDEAIAQAAADTEWATPLSALTWLLVCAWNDLQDARGRALNGKWSITCDHQVGRIVGLTRLVGPANWEVVPVDLILDGVYERIHEAMGMPGLLLDGDRRHAQAVMDRRTTNPEGDHHV